jgi:hypothetical protein
MRDNYRRKDFFAARSMREAFGRDDSFEPEIRCCSEMFGVKQKRRIVGGPLIAAACLIVWAVITKFGH